MHVQAAQVDLSAPGLVVVASASHLTPETQAFVDQLKEPSFKQLGSSLKLLMVSTSGSTRSLLAEVLPLRPQRSSASSKSRPLQAAGQQPEAAPGEIPAPRFFGVSAGRAARGWRRDPEMFVCVARRLWYTGSE